MAVFHTHLFCSELAGDAQAWVAKELQRPGKEPANP